MRTESLFKTETEFIGGIRSRTPGKVKGLTLGIGDDAALVRIQPGHELILTTDMSTEGVHFISTMHPPQSVGHRALARSLSDIAAMGGVPRYALISIAISAGKTRNWLTQFFNGFFTLAQRFSTVLIGGDTAVVNGATSIDVIVAGEVRRGRAVRRSGAQPGDRIFVSGQLGMAALGLRLLPLQARRPAAIEQAARRAHLYPQPQCSLGQYLAKNRLASAMMDLSDGLSTDLGRLCEASGVGAVLFQNQIPIPAIADSGEALELALHGGEDYQLLFTAPRTKAARLPRRYRRISLHCIGEICASRGIYLTRPDGNAAPVQPQGYDHFARTQHL